MVDADAGNEGRFRVDVAMIWTDDGKNEITGWNIEVKKKPD